MYQQICCILSILPKAKYVAYATSLPVQHQLCCYCRVYEEESQVYNKATCIAILIIYDIVLLLV